MGPVDKLTTNQKISVTIAAGLLFILFWYRDTPIHTQVNAEWVYVQYRGEVDLSSFDCTDTTSSFVHRVCYDSASAYMIVKENGKYYHYCDVPDQTVEEFEAAPSVGRFYLASIKKAL